MSVRILLQNTCEHAQYHLTAELHSSQLHLQENSVFVYFRRISKT